MAVSCLAVSGRESADSRPKSTPIRLPVTKNDGPGAAPSSCARVRPMTRVTVSPGAAANSIQT